MIKNNKYQIDQYIVRNNIVYQIHCIVERGSVISYEVGRICPKEGYEKRIEVLESDIKLWDGTVKAQ